MKRVFFPNEEWIYFKIYGSIKETDYFLINCITPIVEILKKDSLIAKWFFIRYFDPEYHIRIRFQCQNIDKNAQIYSLFLKHIHLFISSCNIWKVQLDTYNREIERYGEETIDLVESVFEYDSEMVINILSLIEGDIDEISRWKYSISLIDTYLNLFELESLNKLKLVSELSESYKNEFNVDKQLNFQINNLYRKHKIEILNILDLSANNDFRLTYTTRNISPIIKEINCLVQFNESDLNSLLKSIIHMSLNRLFRTKQRMYELVIYSFLEKSYKTFLNINHTTSKCE
ncbi:MAG: hypothetical protein EHM93_04890 [Bacteroidales bacterium]|nr:MAG: hypothetical protein EHM93_04890 [Bacteroidales bacterium]